MCQIPAERLTLLPKKFVQTVCRYRQEWGQSVVFIDSLLCTAMLVARGPPTLPLLPTFFFTICSGTLQLSTNLKNHIGHRNRFFNSAAAAPLLSLMLHVLLIKNRESWRGHRRCEQKGAICCSATTEGHHAQILVCIHQARSEFFEPSTNIWLVKDILP